MKKKQNKPYEGTSLFEYNLPNPFQKARAQLIPDYVKKYLEVIAKSRVKSVAPNLNGEWEINVEHKYLIIIDKDGTDRIEKL